jgi:hypothetical protein
MPPIQANPFRRTQSPPPPFVGRAVERILDNEAIRADLTDAEYGPLLDRAVKSIETAGARLGPGARFEAAVDGILTTLKADVRQLGQTSRLDNNGSEAYRLLQAFARGIPLAFGFRLPVLASLPGGINATLDQREAELLVRRTFTSPMDAKNLATLQQLFTTPSGKAVAFDSPMPGEPMASLTMTPSAYRVLAEAVGFIAFPR